MVEHRRVFIPGTDIEVMKRLTPEMKVTVRSVIEERHANFVNDLKTKARSILSGENKEKEALGPNLVQYNELCKVEFPDLIKNLYILNEVFSDIVGDIWSEAETTGIYSPLRS